MLVEREGAAEHVERTYVIHRGGADGDQCSDDQRALHRYDVQPEIGFEAFARARLELRDFMLLPPERLHHFDRTEPILTTREHRTFTLGDGGGFGADALGEKHHGPDHEGDDRQREERELPVETPHHR